MRTEHGNTDYFQVEKGVRKGCILSPLLFNIYAEKIIRDSLAGFVAGVKIGGRSISNLRYADDTSLLTSTEQDMKELIQQVKQHSEEAGLYLNLSKTKIMSTAPLQNFQVNGDSIEVVRNFQFLGVTITHDALCESEVKRRLCLGRKAMTGLTKIWKDKNISLQTKIKLVNALVFPVVLYGCETWVMRKAERRRVDAFELWCWRRLLRVSWTERRTNKWILDKIKPQQTLESFIATATLRYAGHVMRANGSLEKDIMTGMMEGRRRKGRPRKGYWEVIKDLCGKSLEEVRAAAGDRRGWRSAVIDVARGRSRLDGTR